LIFALGRQSSLAFPRPACGFGRGAQRPAMGFKTRKHDDLTHFIMFVHAVFYRRNHAACDGIRP